MGSGSDAARILRGCRCRGDGGRRKQQVEQPVVDALVGEVFDFGFALLPHHLDGAVDEIADHAFHVATDVAHLGELRRFDLDERRAGELRESSRDLRLPHAGRADEDDVVRRDLVADGFGRLLPAPAISQRDGDGLLRIGLPDDVPVELCDDLARRQVGQARERLLRAGRRHVSLPRGR